MVKSFKSSHSPQDFTFLRLLPKPQSDFSSQLCFGCKNAVECNFSVANKEIELRIVKKRVDSSRLIYFVFSPLVVKYANRMSHGELIKDPSALRPNRLSACWTDANSIPYFIMAGNVVRLFVLGLGEYKRCL